MSNIEKRNEYGLMPSRKGQTVSAMGVGALAIGGLAALLPGGILFWAVVVILAGLVF